MRSTTPLVILTGMPGVGKTTLCQRVVARARRAGVPIRGVLSERRTEQDLVVGLDAIDVASDTRLPLAEIGRPADGPVAGQWHFHATAFTTGLSWCAHACVGDILFIDEIGPLELDQHAGWAPLIPLARDHDGHAVVVVRPALVERFVGIMAPRATYVVQIVGDRRLESLQVVAEHLGLDAW
jgi:nucleoside-triphosphatase THEP1